VPVCWAFVCVCAAGFCLCLCYAVNQGGHLPGPVSRFNLSIVKVTIHLSYLHVILPVLFFIDLQIVSGKLYISLPILYV